MAAPAGNQFWKLRSKVGRDRLFDTSDALWDAACEYFNWVDAHPWFKVEQLKKPIFERDPDPDSKEGRGKWITITKIPTARPYTMQGLCLYLDCNLVYFNQFEYALKGREDEASLAFSKIISRIRETIFMQKFEGAAVGAFNSNLIARELGIRDNLGLTDGEGKPLQTAPALHITVMPTIAQVSESEE